jgi:small subunit ribosomal protein S4
MVNNRKRYKPLYKKFIRLKVNPLNNNKVFKFRKKKWHTFLGLLKKTNTFHRKFKPYAHSNYSTSKFASQGNSYKRKFRNDLIAKKTFNYFYGGLKKKYLKTQMTKIYRSKEFRDPTLTCFELFESRLDSVLYRSKFSYSIKNARQLIAHKHVKVNNRIEKNKSYILKQGDLIQINPKSVELIKKNLREQLSYDLREQFENMKKHLREDLKKPVRENLKRQMKDLKKQLDAPYNKVWPMPPTYLTINYNTLEIIFGDLKNYNFSTSFPFRINIDSVVTNYYRH